MKRFVRWMAAPVAIAGLSLGLMGCSTEEPAPAAGAMEDGKMKGGAMDGGAMEGDKMKGAMEGGKMEGAMEGGKMSGEAPK